MTQEHIERRKYIRLNSCFPVEFSLSFIKDKAASDEYQGFTCDVSEGGLCLSARNLKPKDIEAVLAKSATFNLKINIPLFFHPAKATAQIAWSKKDDKDPSGKTCLIGLSYINIQPNERKRIIVYAKRLKWMPRIAVSGVIILFIGLLIVSAYHIKTKKQNENLLKELVLISEVKTSLEKRLNEAKFRKEMLESKFLKGIQEIESIKKELSDIETKTDSESKRLQEELNKALAEKKITQDMALNKKIELLQFELSEITNRSAPHIENLKAQLKKLQEENVAYKQKLLTAEQGKVSLEEQFAKIRLKSGGIEKANIDKMLGWLRVHQVKRTGLVLSYEGDKALENFGFTYDEALACQIFLISGDRERSAMILDFYMDKAKRSEGLFYNAYDAKNGSPCEYTVHSGPNIWIAISACQYTNRTKDERFLSLAEGVADMMIRLQKSSSDGSIKGGPRTEWVSTEHNLDAYALFRMLYEVTKDKKYDTASQATLKWLRDVGYNRPEGRFQRGRGDSTIATDTFSWAIAALGPQALKANGMDPDGIMEFAENECKVETKFYRPEGKQIDLTGFDFAKASNLGRGGIVSTEWTAQMVVAFKIMADYYKGQHDTEKESIYRSKAEYYLTQLSLMAISSPSPTGQGEGCLPYASMDNVDTGHGWRVASGRRTGSVAGTAYYIFAYQGFNPLVLQTF